MSAANSHYFDGFPIQYPKLFVLYPPIKRYIYGSSEPFTRLFGTDGYTDILKDAVDNQILDQ